MSMLNGDKIPDLLLGHACWPIAVQTCTARHQRIGWKVELWRLCAAVPSPRQGAELCPDDAEAAAGGVGEGPG